MRKTLLLAFAMLFSASSSFAAIAITDGYWSTTFDCADWTQPAALSCDGAEMDNDSAYAGAQGSLINAAGNHAAGDGGKGWRTYMAGGSLNEMSSPMQITFASAQPEIWLRFYYRIPSGQTVAGTPAHKIIYVWGSTTFRIDWPYYDNIQIEGDVNRVYPPGGDAESDVDLGNWIAIYGGDPGTAAADGSWHLFEFHFDVGTTASNGVFQMWVDEVNIINDTNLNMGAGAGFTSIDLPNNHNVFALSGNNPHDIDDVAVALPSYAGFVQNTTGFATGLDMIGPLGAPADTTAPTAAITQSDPQAITSNTLTITGTCTGDGDEAGAKWRIGSAPDANNGTACTGTTDFSCDTSGYSVGANTLYVGCYDEVPNYGSDSITVNYTQASLIGSPSGSFTIH